MLKKFTKFMKTSRLDKVINKHLKSPKKRKHESKRKRSLATRS